MITSAFLEKAAVASREHIIVRSKQEKKFLPQKLIFLKKIRMDDVEIVPKKMVIKSFSITISGLSSPSAAFLDGCYCYLEGGFVLEVYTQNMLSTTGIHVLCRKFI